MTVFLTTHYLEEAEACDQVAFLAAGKIIGAGTPASLVHKFGPYVLEIDGTGLETIAELLSPRLGPCLKEGGTASFRVLDEKFSFAELQAELNDSVQAVRWRRPNLNDVFLWVNDPTLSAGLEI